MFDVKHFLFLKAELKKGVITSILSVNGDKLASNEGDMNTEQTRGTMTTTKRKRHNRHPQTPGRHTWRLHRDRVPGSEYRVTENYSGCRIDYEGLNAMLRGLGYKTSSWDPR